MWEDSNRTQGPQATPTSFVQPSLLPNQTTFSRLFFFVENFHFKISTKKFLVLKLILNRNLIFDKFVSSTLLTFTHFCSFIFQCFMVVAVCDYLFVYLTLTTFVCIRFNQHNIYKCIQIQSTDCFRFKIHNVCILFIKNSTNTTTPN